MKTAISLVTALFALLLTGVSGFAEEPAGEKLTYLKLPSAQGVPRPAVADEQLAVRQADFEQYARAKVREMNTNHLLARARMQIGKEKGGLYRAMYHEIDDASLSYQVRRSESKSNPFVAVLSYQERVFTASCATPDECRRADFVPVEVIPNRHIFTYGKGGWQ